MSASVSNISVSANSYAASYVSLTLDGGSTTIHLTEDEKQQLLSIGLQLFFARQADIAAQIAAIPNPLLPPPPSPVDTTITDAEWTLPGDDDGAAAVSVTPLPSNQ